MLAGLNTEEPGSRHVMQLLDHFHIKGPNGKHECLVLEFLGPSVTDVLDMRFNDERLPGTLAKASMQQALVGLTYLHKYNIGHGGTSIVNRIVDTPLTYRRSAHAKLGFCHPFITYSHGSRTNSKAAKSSNWGCHKKRWTIIRTWRA